MKFDIVGRNVEVTPAMHEYVEKKIGKLKKYFEAVDRVDTRVTFKVEKGKHIVEVTIPVHGSIIRGEERSGDMYASVDLVAEKLERQLTRYKDRVNHRRSVHVAHGQPESVGTADSVFERPGENFPKLMRTKRFDFKPMDADEAVMQMDLLGHDFYVFANSASNKVNVVYRRRDGNYGLIEPNF